MTGPDVGLIIVLVTFAGWLRAVWAARPWPLRDRGRG